MEQTPLPPLLSDKILAQALCLSDECLWLRAQYEEDRQRTREVVQALVNLVAELRCKEGCRKYEPGGTAPLCYQCGERHRILALAKSQLQIEPTKP